MITKIDLFPSYLPVLSVYPNTWMFLLPTRILLFNTSHSKNFQFYGGCHCNDFLHCYFWYHSHPPLTPLRVEKYLFGYQLNFLVHNLLILCLRQPLRMFDEKNIIISPYHAIFIILGTNIPFHINIIESLLDDMYYRGFTLWVLIVI